MASGYQADKARKDAVNALGRELARRSKSRCELCGEGGRRLEVVEVPPLAERPEAGRAVLLCEPCADGVMGRVNHPAERWRFLEEVVWSEVAPVQVTAVRMARKLSEDGVGWARDLLAGLYLAPEIEAWVEGKVD